MRTEVLVRKMKNSPPSILTINGGSSSLRFTIYQTGHPRLLLSGKMDRLGLNRTTLTVDHPETRTHRVASGVNAVEFFLTWLSAQPAFESVAAVGHRVVHGMKHSEPTPVTAKLVAELRRIVPYDPDHLPREIALIEAFRHRHSRLRQVACFDTAFHRAMPAVARTLPLPRRYAAKGVERYGFHGLSYQFLMEELSRMGAAGGRVILAHLGNGASLAAVRDGHCVDTSMGFTPAAGLVMSTRSGDLDPGLAYYLARTDHITPARFQHLVNHESGLLGISGTSSDVRDLLARERRDPRAALAIEVFCYQVRKWIGAYAAALGGLDTVVFSAGIGENSPAIRKRICEGLGFLGLELDGRRNSRNGALISKDSSSVTVRVVRTNEELMLARSVSRVLQFDWDQER